MGDTAIFVEVDYNAHRQQYAEPFLIEGNPGSNRYFEHQAQEMHVLAVSQAVDRLTQAALLLVPSVALSPPAERLFRYGVMRRWRMISTSFRDFRSIVWPDRTIPLSRQQSDLCCRALNAIYIDLHGLLDNYAWTLVYLVGSEKSRASKPMAISLFSDAFRADPALSTVASQLASFEPWALEFRNRRHPAAHRIPLHVPSSAMTEADVIEHRRIDDLASDALARADFDLAAKYQEATWKIGAFEPLFLHDPTEAAMPIFPTLPEDIGQAVRIGRIAQEFMRAAGQAA